MKRLLKKQPLFQKQTTLSIKKQETLKSANDKEQIISAFIYGKEAVTLHTYRKHFGVENFLNIYKAFYILSKIPEDC
jgi:hypothetical protein